MPLIYLLDDDAAVAARIGPWVEQIGCSLQSFVMPHAYFYALQKNRPMCAVIDWRLPEMDGVSVVRRTREVHGHRVGLLMLTSMDTEQSVVEALEAGADDFVVKPATEKVFRARLLALMRRIAVEASDDITVLERGPYVLDREARTVTVDGRRCDIAPREFDLAWTLFREPSRLLTKHELLAAIWGKDLDVGSATITQHIYLLRRKLELASHGITLSSVYGVGYRLDLPP